MRPDPGLVPVAPVVTAPSSPDGGIGRLNNCRSETDIYRHGGRLRAAMALYPGAARPWLDLSTGINPGPFPARRATTTARSRLPDPADLAELEVMAAKAFGASPARVCATAGVEAALHLLPLALDVKSVAVVGPTYGGHAEAWRAAGADVEAAVWPLDPTRLTAEAVVLVNPNNPDGRTLAAEAMAELVETLGRKGCWMIVDEAFADAVPAVSVAAQAGDRLVVLRSFGKFYGLAGVRLGFVLGDPQLLRRLRARQGDWPVCADAIAAGMDAYADTAWAERTRRRLARDAARLDGLLRRAGWEVLGGTPLFRLARSADARARFERLAERGVLARPFDHAPDQLRFGLPPRRAWRRLEAALMESAR